MSQEPKLILQSGDVRLQTVVAGVIQVRPDTYIICKRGPKTSLPGTWCFPGGKLEPGEGWVDGLRREIAEEIRIQVVVGALTHKQLVLYSHGAFMLHFFECHAIDAGMIEGHWFTNDEEISEVACVTPDHFKEYALLEGDEVVANMIYYKHEIRRLRRDVARSHQAEVQMRDTLTSAQEQGTKAIQYSRDLERQLSVALQTNYVPKSWPDIMRREV